MRLQDVRDTLLVLCLVTLPRDQGAASDYVRSGQEAASGYVRSGQEAASDYVRSGQGAASDYVRSGQTAAPGYVHSGQEAASDYVRSGQGAASDYVRSGQEAASDYVRSGQEAASDYVHSGQEAASGYVRSGQEAASGYVHSGQEAASGYVRSGQEAASDYVRSGQGAASDYVRSGQGAASDYARSGQGAASHYAWLDAGSSSERCDKARLQCTTRTGCQMALSNFFQGCNSIMMGTEEGCPKTCQHALVSLLTAEDGAGLAFINCNCSSEPTCEERKGRVQVCQQQVLHSMHLLRHHDTPVSCSFARGICEADTSCLAALQYYMQHCSKLFTATRCSAKCRNSVHILYRQPNARKLRSCRCEGDEDYDCHSLVTNTERLCFHRHHQHNHSSLDAHHPEDDVHDDVIGDFRQPGRRHWHPQTSGRAPTDSSGPPDAPPRPSLRRKRRNKPGEKKRKSSRRNFTGKQKGRRVLKGRGESRRQSKARKDRKRLTGQRQRLSADVRCGKEFLEGGNNGQKPCGPRRSTRQGATSLKKVRKLKSEG